MYFIYFTLSRKDISFSKNHKDCDGGGELGIGNTIKNRIDHSLALLRLRNYVCEINLLSHTIQLQPSSWNKYNLQVACFIPVKE